MLNKEWTLWHLTPRGWVKGTEQTGFASMLERPAPNDRVMSCVFFKELIESPQGPSYDHWLENVFMLPTPSQIKFLLDRYGTCPETL